MMIAGGSSYAALRYGVSSDTGHKGLVIQEGVGLFGGGIVDQNLVGGNRLGRLIVACAEENERFGIGVFEDSAAVASHAGTRLEAAGRQGFVLVEIDPDTLDVQSDSFVARGVRLTVLAAGDRADLASGAVERAASPSPRPASSAPSSPASPPRATPSPPPPSPAAGSPPLRGLTLAVRSHQGATALVDIECPRDENG
ncbi:MAG: hypothetical protein U1E59_07440 [Amaricoccus sp.]